MKTKVIFFLGGVYSSVGKGLTLANVGKILKTLGFKVSALKLDPYLNIDSGNLSPCQHGEVYVTCDGHETDLDLGHYERLIGNRLTKSSCVTAGRIYESLLGKNSQNSGETIQIIPHFVDAINDYIYGALDSEDSLDFLLVEIGGTVGDMELVPFLEAIYRFKCKYGGDDVLFISVSPILYISASDEFKTKPTQHHLQRLSSHNIIPDLLVLRSSIPLDDEVKKKFSVNSNIEIGDLVCCIDNPNIYMISNDLFGEGIHEKILEKLHIKVPEDSRERWGRDGPKPISPKGNVRVAIVGKYSTKDSYLSIIESIKISSFYLALKPEIELFNVESMEDLSILNGYDAVCVPYGFGPRGTEEKIRIIRHCRENGIPFLGICYGMQLAVIEYARNVLGHKEASSTEINPETKIPLFIRFEDGEMRLGNGEINVIEGTIAKGLFGDSTVARHRHRYHFNNDYLELFKDGDMVISAFSNDEMTIAEMIELKNHPFFVATQFHPEFEAQFSNPYPLFTRFIEVANKNSRCP